MYYCNTTEAREKSAKVSVMRDNSRVERERDTVELECFEIWN